MNRIGIIADDLTGATTTGVLLARSGLKTVALLDADESVELSKDVEAIVLSTNSRSLPTKDARVRVDSAFDVLMNYNTIQYSKRIDTTMRGGIGCEVETMLDRLGNEYIGVMVPSMPQSNRILVGGYSIINGVSLSKTDVANDVLTPIHDTHVPTLFRKQTNMKIGEIQLASILAGKEALRNQFIKEKEKGSRIIICDAVSLEDIELITEVLVELEWDILAIDPGPFTNALATKRLNNKQVRNVNKTEDIKIKGQSKKVLMFIGSATSVTKEQIGNMAMQEFSTSITIPAIELINEVTRKDTIFKAIEDIENAFNNSQEVIIIDTAVFSPTLNLSNVERDLNLNVGEASELINSGLGIIAKNILKDRGKSVAGIYLTGGDTMVSILKELGTDGITLLDYVIPQTDIGRLLNGPFKDMLVIGKGGLTGTVSTPIDAVKELYRLDR